MALLGWQQRTNDSIRLRSPDGQEFTALWARDTRVKEKKLGVFSPPLSDGAIIQDMGIKAFTIPMTIYFDGNDHDLTAERFFLAANERGAWGVDHPRKGLLALQLSSITEVVSGTDGANYTSFDLIWLEVKEEAAAFKSVPAESIEAQMEEVNSVSSEQVTEKTPVSRFSMVQAVRNAAGKVVTSVQGALAPIYNLSSTLSGEITSSIASLQGALAEATVDVAVVVAHLQTIIQAPAMVNASIASKIAAYQDLTDRLISGLPVGVTAEDLNGLNIFEAAMTATNGAVARAVTIGDLFSRPDVLSHIDGLNTLFFAFTNALEDAQDRFDGYLISNRYFAQSRSYDGSAKVTALALNYLLRALFDLLIEKRFILARPRAPIEIVLSEYGSEEYFDLFITSNGLKGDEILVLPAGREVVVYVSAA